MSCVARPPRWFSGPRVIRLPGGQVYSGEEKNVLADQLSCPDQVLPAEWSLLPRVLEAVCRVFGRPHLDLFATLSSAKLPLYLSPVSDPMAWKQDVF